LKVLRIITDFDGPIVDLSRRYYRVYQDCLQQVQAAAGVGDRHDFSGQTQSIARLSFSEFWQLKQAKIPETEIGIKSGLNTAQARKFAQLRQHNAHALPNLQYDQLVPGAVAALTQIRLWADLVVMTMRRQQELDYAIAQFNLADLLPGDRRFCIRNDYLKRQDVLDKPRLMATALTQLPAAKFTWMIGDTEADIVSAKIHNIPVIAVLSGIRDRARLISYYPDYIVKDLSAAVQLIIELMPASLKLAQKTTD
jgi:phosphoglycolate phosphatase-like HAD superfamily hydrolase